MVVASMTGLGIVIGLILAAIQSATRKRIFSGIGIIIALVFGATLGATKALVAAAGTGGYLSLAVMIPETMGWTAKALIIGVLLILVRRLMMTDKKESFSARISVTQVLGFLLSLTIIAVATYGEVESAKLMRVAATSAVDTFKNVTSTEGLQITNNPSGYIDSNGDLVITGVVENTTDKEKPIWYLVASVFDAQGSVLIQAKVLSGRQIYTPRDYEIFTKRGVNVQELAAKLGPEKGTPLPPHGMSNFEIRIMEPPIGIATFNTVLQKFDPLLMVKEAAEQIKNTQQ